jgi:predicted metal-dependent HD superfamily phosphohydrolase
VPHLARLWPDRADPSWRDRLEQAYDDPARGYHDVRHLAEVLENVDALMADGDPARDAVLLAAWFHDAVYDGAPDDEERSAALAETALSETPELAAEVARLVRLTAAHRPDDDDPAGQVLCDADLAILASDDERYASYTAGVRREHAHVPDAEFRAGRAAVLRALLDKPTLFHTSAGRERWEARARDNVRRELEMLDGRDE